MENTNPEKPNQTTESELNKTTTTDQQPVAMGSAEVITPAAPVVQAKKSKKSLIIVAVVLIAVLGGAGAWAMTHKSKKSPASDASTATVKKSIAQLRVGVTQPFPADYYPNIENNNFSAELTNQMFEGLTKYQNGNQIVPNLADSWSNPDNLTWVFKLKSNIKFHNGHALTSAQVKDSLIALETNDFGSSYTTTIKNVEATDTSTVKITTSTPDPLLPNELTNLWIYDTTATTPNDPANGTGPYTIKPGTKLTAESVQLVAYDGYHGTAPLAKELDFIYYADTDSEVKAIQQNKLDIADLGSKDTVASVESYGYNAYADKSLQVNFLMPNTLKTSSPLAKLAVRQAVYEALDPDAITKADGRTGTAANQLVPQEVPGYNAAIKRPSLDPTKAKADLAVAGYPNGFTTSLTYYAPHQGLATEIQKELAAIGVTLTLDPQTKGSVLAQKTSSGGTDMYYFGYSTSVTDTYDVISPLVTGSANYKNSQIDTLYSKASTTFDTAARIKLMQQISQLAMSDVAVMPVNVPDAEYFAVKSNLVVRLDNLSYYMGIDFDNVYAK